MSSLLNPTARQLLVAPFERERGVHHLGRSLWLYLHLVLEVDRRGLVLRQTDKLAAKLQVAEPDIEEWLVRLQNAGLIKVLSPSPFLVFKLRLWSGSDPFQQEIRPPNAPVVEGCYSSNSSYSYLQSPKQQAIAGEDRGAGEGEALLHEILATLGESDPEPFRKVLDLHSPERIRAALARVRATAPGEIRKSKTALFRYLLGKIT